MRKIFPLLAIAGALCMLAPILPGCSNSSGPPPSPEYVAFNTLAASNKAVDSAAKVFATLFVRKENENEYSKLIAPREYDAEKARLQKIDSQFSSALDSYYAARDAAIQAAIAAKVSGTPMETPAMATAAATIAQLIVTLTGGAK